MNTSIEDYIEQHSIPTDRLNNQVSEDEALALSFYLNDRREPSHTLNAFTREPQLQALAAELAANADSKDEWSTEQATSALKSIQSRFQLNDDDWGALSPYLEELLAAEHPHVRLKTPGKYNAEGRHKVLLRTHPGEGGWSPAIVIPSRHAEKMWKAAGLEYPKNLKGDTEDQIAQHADRYEQASLSYAISRRRRLRQQIHDIHLELEAITPVIRKENLEEVQRRLPELVTVTHQAESETEALKAKMHVIEACLTALSVDQEVDAHTPEFQIFSRAFNIIERDIGRNDSKEALKNDHERIEQAMTITRSLITSLPNDSVGAPLKSALSEYITQIG